MVKPEDCSPTLVRVTFWGMSGGIALLTILSMLPTGVYLFYLNMELGCVCRDLLLVGFGLGFLLLSRGVQNVFTREYTWSIRAWLFCGCSVMVFFLCFVFNMIPETYFIFFDFQRNWWSLCGLR